MFALKIHWPSEKQHCVKVTLHLSFLFPIDSSYRILLNSYRQYGEKFQKFDQYFFSLLLLLLSASYNVTKFREIGTHISYFYSEYLDDICHVLNKHMRHVITQPKKYKRIKDVRLIKTFASTDCYKPSTICISNIERRRLVSFRYISSVRYIRFSESACREKSSSGFLIHTHPASCFSLIHTPYSRFWNEIRGSRSNVEFSRRFSRVSYCEKWLQRAARELERRNAWNWASNTIPAFYGRRSVRGVNGERVNRLANCMS